MVPSRRGVALCHTESLAFSYYDAVCVTPSLSGQNPKRFGEFVKEHLKPMLT